MEPDNSAEGRRIDDKALAGKDPWWRSSAIVGGIAAVFAGIGAAFGLDPVGLGEDLSNIAVGGVAVFGGIVSIIGRIKARKAGD